MKRVSVLLITIVVAAAMMFAFPAFADDTTEDDGTGTNDLYVQGQTLGPNGKAAKTYFGATQEIIYEKATVDTIQNALYDARGITADTNKPVIVNIKSGTYNLSGALSIPHNVILVSESEVVYNRTGSDKMVKLAGSVFGGKFDGKNKKNNIIQLVSTTATASDKNMTVMKTTLCNTKLSKHAAVQIDANGKAIRHGKIIDNAIDNCYNGVSVYDGGSYDIIRGNTFTKIGIKDYKGGSAIDVCSSNVGKIQNNTINGVVGHGISTDPTSDKGKYRNGCKIKEISGNTISNINTQGIYIEKRCIVSKIRNNNISNIKGCCVTVDKNATVSAFSGNKLSGGKLAKKGKHSLMTLGGKKSYVKVENNNTFSGGPAAGIYIGKKARLVITGNGNIITRNKLNGIQMDQRSVLTIKGKTKITKNRWGINMAKYASASIKKVTFRSNRKGAVYYLKGAKFKKSSCSVKGKIFKAK